MNDLEFNEYIDYISNLSSIVGIDIDYHPYLKYNRKNKNKYERDRLTYMNITRKLINMLSSMFEWELPKELNKRTIELSFIFCGGICLSKSNKGILCLPCRSLNRLNVYGEPTQVKMFGYNGYNEVVDIKNDIDFLGNETLLKVPNINNTIGIYARDNKLAYPPIKYIIETATKITDKKRAIDVLSQKLKSPFVFNCSKENESNVKKALDALFENDNVVISNSNSLSKTENLVNQNNIDKNMSALKEGVLFDYNNFLETFGINTNPNPDKKERLIVDEVNSNNDTLILYSKSRYNERLDFCKRAKEYLNIDINVKSNYNMNGDNNDNPTIKEENTKKSHKEFNRE